MEKNEVMAMRKASLKSCLASAHRRAVLFLALFLAVTVLILCGCGKKGKEETSSQGGAEASQEAEKDPGKLEAVFFDVGKGDCILFSNLAGHVLIDTGYEETAEEILQELEDRGVTSLDAMIITHYDKDHVGGAARIAEEIPPAILYLPDYDGDEDKCGDLLDLIDENDMNAVSVSSDKSFSLGNVKFTVDAALVSYDPEEENDNDASLIVEVFNGEDRWLLPGDIEKEAIKEWLDSREGERYDVLKMPHHGRKNGKVDEFIESVSPKICVITDSLEDEAAPKVLEELEDEGAEVYRSSTDGTITITSDGKKDFDIKKQR